VLPPGVSSEASETSVVAHVLHRQARGRVGRQVDRVGGVHDAGLQVEHLEDTLEAHQCGHHVDPDVGERGQGAVEPGEVRGERDQRADAEVPLRGEAAPHTVGDGQRQRRDQRQRDEEDPAVDRLRHTDVAHAGGALAEAPVLDLRGAEELDQQGAR